MSDNTRAQRMGGPRGGHGHGHHGMMPGEKAADFKGSMLNE